MENLDKLTILLLAIFITISTVQGQAQNHGRKGHRDKDRRGGGLKELTCYVCSGKFPDRDCELYPEYVTMGPGKLNCTRNYCSTIVRYKPKTYLLTLSLEKKLTGTKRPLTPQDFDVDSIARECEDIARGNKCEMDPDDLGITCYSMCNTKLCNKDVPSPKKYSFRKSGTTRSMSEATTTMEPEIREESKFASEEEDEFVMRTNMNNITSNDVEVEMEMKNETRVGDTLTDDTKLHRDNKFHRMGDKKGMRRNQSNGAEAIKVSFYFIIELSFSLIMAIFLQNQKYVHH